MILINKTPCTFGKLPKRRSKREEGTSKGVLRHFRHVSVGLFFLVSCLFLVSCRNNVHVDMHVTTLTSITISPVNPSIAHETTQQFTATGTFSDHSTQDITATVTWSSSNVNVATVNNSAGSNGLASATGAGTSTITATSGTVAGSTTLTVTSATLVSIEVTPASPSIALGTTQQFTATGTFSDSTTQNITATVAWSSSAPGVATVSNNAGSQGLATPVAAGSTTILATMGAISNSATLTVTSATLVSMAITPVNPGIVVGTTQQFAATGAYSDNSTQSLTTSATWSTSNAGVATVSTTGLATAVSAGTATISAVSGGVYGTALLTVAAPSMPTGAPQILYTDIVAGSTTGGENNKGAYLSIFGKNFGSTGLGTTVKVYINDVEVGVYKYLGPSKGRSDIQQITVQVGSLGSPAAGTPFPIKVVVNGVASNTDQTFIVQPGNFLFVDPVNGNDSTAVKNDITHPWKNVQLATPDSAAIGAAAPGDTLVLRAGTYTGSGFDDYWLKFYFISPYGMTGNAPTGAAGHGYITVTSYPTESVYIHPTASTNYGVISGTGSNPSSCQVSYIVIANLKVEGGSVGNIDFHDGPVNLQLFSCYWRVVNNELSSPNAPFDAKSGRHSRRRPV